MRTYGRTGRNVAGSRRTSPPRQQRRFASLLAAVAVLAGVGTALGAPNPPRAGALGPNAIVTGFNSTTYGANDDGSWPCTGQTVGVPSGCTPQAMTLPFSVKFFGTTYSSLYLNNNGNLTFGTYLSTYTPYPLSHPGHPIIAPFFADVDTRSGNTVTLGTGTVGGHKAFGVNWPGVGCYSKITSVLDYFQVLLITRSDIATGDFTVEFNYDQIQWTSGRASGGNGTCKTGTAARAGFASGTGKGGSSYEIPGSGTDGAFLDTNTAAGLIHHHYNSSQDGRYAFHFRDGQPTVTSGATRTGVGQGLPGGSTGAAVHNPTCTSGDPVNCASGDFHESVSDFSLRDPGPALALTRTYNSLSATTAGIFGYGWASSDAMHLSAASTGAVTITEGDGSKVTAVPDGSGTYQLPAWADSTLTSSGGTYTYVRHQGDPFTFNATGQLTSITDRNGLSTSLAYSAGKLSTVTDSAGQALAFTYGTNGDVSSVKGPGTATVTYGYDAAGELTSVMDAAGRLTTFGYTATGHHLLLTVTAPNGQSGGPDAGDHLTNVYDATGRVTKQTDPAGLVTRFTYAGNNFSETGGTTTVTDPHGNVEVQDYHSGELTSLTKGSGTSGAATWTYTYGTTLGRTSVTDPTGHTSTMTYDSHGNLISTTDATTKTTTSTYNAFDEPLTVTDPMGIKESVTYDSNGNVLTQTSTGTGGSPTETTTYTYGGTVAGEVTKVTDGAGHVTNYAYDTAGDVTSVTTHPNATVSDTTTITYDALGRPVCEASPTATAASVVCPAAGQPRVADTTTWTYNPDGQVTSSTDPTGNTTTDAYDANGNTTSVTDPSGNVTETTFDADNRTVSVTQGYGTTSASTTTSGYDLAPGTGTCSASVTGATYCTTTTDPNGLVATDYYDAKNELIESVTPNAGTTTKSYDAAGNLLTQTTPGGTATDGYDADNRLTSITYSNPASGFAAAPDVTYTYNADGQRTKMTDGMGTTTYTYDALGRLSSTTNGAGSAVSYGYDLDNEVTSITYPGNHTVTQVYDGAGQETSVTDWLGHTTTFSYDASGNLATQAYPNSTVATYAYNATDQVTSITAKKGSTTLGSFSYTRNADGQVATETDTGVPAPTTQSYGYDPVTRLASTSAGSYRYDPAGNLITLASGATLSYTSGTEQLASLTSGSTTASFTSNAQGDRTTSTLGGTSATYSYDQAGRLTGLTSPPSSAVLSAGGYHTCGRTGSKNVSCWGLNTEGQLGNGTTTNSSAPVEVKGVGGSGVLSTVTAVSAGAHYTCALALGHVYCWGDNTSGQLGDNSYTDSSTPVEVVGGAQGGTDLATVTSVSAGREHACALTASKNLYCWGWNWKGQLGDDTTNNAPTPVEVQGGAQGGTDLATVTAVSAGADHTCALTVSKNAYCWGWEAYGQLGDGTISTTAQMTPAEVVHGAGPATGTHLSTVAQISSGGFHTCAVAASHAYCWGSDGYGELGNNTTTNVAAPVEVLGGAQGGTDLSTVTAVEAGYQDACALSASKSVYCWGRNNDGQLGNGTTGGTTPQTTPVEVLGGTEGGTNLSTVTGLTAGAYHACALTTSTSLYCWGANTAGQLGNGTTTNSSTPVQVKTFSLGAQVHYAYNGDGLRMSTSLAGTKQSFTWDTNAPNGNPSLLAGGTFDYVYGPGGLPLEQIKGTAVLYYVHDQLGSTRLLTDSSGTVVATYTYDPYGALTGSTGSVANPFGFAGAYTDAESGLLYLVDRYYDPATAQFLSVDPAVSITGQPYSYTNDNPVNETDPLGLWGWNPISDVVQAAKDTGHFVATHKKAIEVGAGIALGVAAAATGVGAVIEAAGVASAVAAGAGVAEASTGAIVAGVAATAAGSAATYLDSAACADGNSAACVGRDLGAVGAATGFIATLGSGGLAAGLWELESLPDAIFQGLGAFSAMFGITASVFDITTTAAGASALCGT